MHRARDRLEDTTCLAKVRQTIAAAANAPVPGSGTRKTPEADVHGTPSGRIRESRAVLPKFNSLTTS